MEIISEIGTEDQKQQIEKELEIFREVETWEPPVNLRQIIVAADFEAKINELEGTQSYRSKRGLGSNQITAEARIAKLPDGYAIVLSAALYTELHNARTRYFTLCHELSHVLNRRDFPPIQEDSFVKAQHLPNLYALYDEYSSDRFAFTAVEKDFADESGLWRPYVAKELQGFLNLVTDRHYYKQIRAEIASFRYSADVGLFLRNISPYFDEVALILSHIFATFHQYPDCISRSDLPQSPFVNEKTFALMDFFKSKFEAGSVDLFDGLDLISAFMENFGIRFENRDYGGYCQVLDI